MKIKVVHIVKDLKINGISTVVMNYVKNLDKTKYEITIIAGNPIAEKNRKECIDNDIKLIETPSKTIEGPIKCYKELYKALKKEKYDIVHIHGNSRTITVELLIAKIAGIKKRIAHCHNTQCNNKIISNLLTPLFKLLYSSGLACSEEAGKWMFGKSKFTVLKNGFEIEKFRFDKKQRKEQRKILGIPDDAILIGHVGLFNNQKNHPFILKVFEQVYKKNKNAYLILIGTGPDKKKIESEIERSLYKSNVILYGVSNEIYKLYNAMDIFLFPSKFEGLGIVLLEAQMCGLPCVVSDVIPDEVNLSDKYYELSLECNINLWEDRINKIDFYDNRRNCFNNQNFRKFDIKDNVKELESIYNSLFVKGEK